MNEEDTPSSPSCNRNPSPPPHLQEQIESLEADRIGNTTYSKHWLFTTLMKLIEEVEKEDEAEFGVDVDEELQNELCKLWDMSMNTVMNIFKVFIPVPKEESKRVMTFANEDDFISYRHHVYKKSEEGKDIELSEVGPRFEMQLYQIILGTIDTKDSADVEWVYRPYMNTAKKRKF
ncbi:IMP4 [Mytilus edulis]|uniref:IMP4 n=1 Tax=Mytilus edulis TaxID=6550 RepID=A0A8S3RU99_MYTED|nr:IMP4 [Mytilus edulis]